MADILPFFLSLSNLRSLMKINEDVTWLRQQQIISKLTASTGGDDVMNSTPSNEQWRKEEEEEEGWKAAGVYS